MTPAYSYLPLIYRNDLEKKVGIIESLIGLGLMTGPLIGGLLAEIGGYSLPFWFSIVFTLISLPMSWKYFDKTYIDFLQPNLLPNHDAIDHPNEEIKERLDPNAQQVKENANSNNDEANGQEYRVNYIDLLQQKPFIMAFIITILPTMGLLFLDPTLAPYIESQYGVGPFLIGIVFAANSLLYMVFCPICSIITIKVENNKILLFGGCLVQGLSFLFLGPDSQLLFQMEKRFWISIIANSVMGIAITFIYIPIIPEFLELLEQHYPQNSDELNGDIVSAFNSIGVSLGSFFGPIFGGVFCKYVGFPRAASIFGISIIIFTFYYLSNAGICKKNKKQHNLQDYLIACKSQVSEVKSDMVIARGRSSGAFKFQFSSVERRINLNMIDLADLKKKTPNPKVQSLNLY